MDGVAVGIKFALMEPTLSIILPLQMPLDRELAISQQILNVFSKLFKKVNRHDGDILHPLPLEGEGGGEGENGFFSPP